MKSWRANIECNEATSCSSIHNNKINPFVVSVAVYVVKFTLHIVIDIQSIGVERRTCCVWQLYVNAVTHKNVYESHEKGNDNDSIGPD